MFVVFCRSVHVCTEWLDSRLPESGVHGVCPCSEVCVRPFEAGFWFQVARTQLAAFVGLKHSEALGFLKKQCHFCVCVCVFYIFFPRNLLFDSDYIIFLGETL